MKRLTMNLDLSLDSVRPAEKTLRAKKRAARRLAREHERWLALAQKHEKAAAEARITADNYAFWFKQNQQEIEKLEQ